MKKNYRSLAVLAAFFFASFGVSAQESPQKPIKKLKVFTEEQRKEFKSAQQVLQQELRLPEGNSFSLISEDTDELGFHHKEYQQFFNSVKVEFGKSTVHLDNGTVKSMSNNVFRIKDLNVNPSIDAAQALNKAMAHVGAQKYLWQNEAEAEMLNYHKPEGELVVFPAVNNINKKSRLAYKFDIYASNPVYRADVYIDAHTGEFIMENNRIHHANTPANGSSLYNGNVSFTADSYNGYYRLRQSANGNGVQTFDMNNGTNYSNASEITSNSTTFNHATGVQAHWGAEQTHKYFSQHHGRNSYDNNGSVIRSYVSYDSNYVNAFWDGSRMTYGDGDGVDYGPLVALDIVGHEIGHGVTEYAANLVYSYESGALNESFSDIFGEHIEKFATGTNDWLMGDEIGAGGSGGALRSISNPNAYNQPDTYQGDSWYFGSGDSGGVHYNSGVQNYWFYLLSTGGSGTNDNGDSYNVSAIGMNKAASVAYRNLTVYLNSNSEYADARAGSIQAAIDLYGAGSPEEIAVTNAWHAVGVGAAYDDGGGTTPDPAECATGDVYLSITFDNYPEETAWTLKDASGNTVDSDSYSSSNGDGSTVNVTFPNLDAGDYTFTITDDYGDGICCSYGSGSYTISSDDGTIFSGGDFNSSESTTFCVEGGGSTADTQAPSTPTNLSASNVTETTVDLSWNASSDNVGVSGYDVYQNGSLLGSTTGTTAQVTGLSAATTYNFSVRAKDDAGNISSASNSVSVTTSSAPSVSYCNTQGNNSSYEWIDLVRLNNMSNSTGNDGGYADYTSKVANLPYGSNTINISAGFSGSSYREYWKIWIDFNQNGNFESGELLVSGSSSSSGTLSASFNVPSSAMSGTTRMRVSMKYNSAQSACESFSYGEVEDYTVNVGQGFNAIANNEASEPLGSEQGNSGFDIYPNPVTGNFLNVRMNGDTNASYKVYDMLGKLVQQGKVVNRAIDVQGISQGVYVLQLNDGQKDVSIKFVKQ